MSLGRAVLLAPEPPYPMHGGGQIRTASLYTWLRQHYTTHLIQFREGHSEQNEDLVTIPLTPHARTTPARLIRNARRILRGVAPLNDRFSGYEAQVAAALGQNIYDLAIVEHLWAAHYLPVLKPVARRVVLDLHNIESTLLAGIAKSSELARSLVFRRFSRAALESERHWIPRFDTVIVTSDADAERLKSIVPAARILVYPNALPERQLAKSAHSSFSIAFSGNFEYGPNSSGARWFARSVWPLLRQRHPGLIWRLVGRGANQLRGEFSADPLIAFTGEVEDAIGSLAESRVAVVPLLAGSGTRLKILEAWQSGLPVVSTTIGAEGFGASGILREDTPSGFADAVSKLLLNPQYALEIALDGRRALTDCYIWPVAWRALDNLAVT